MARFWQKSKGKIPKNITIQLLVNSRAEVVFGPYFSTPSEDNGFFKNINFKLCDTTGNYIRQTPIQEFEKLSNRLL